MGLGSSKFFSKGSLKGAYAPPLPGIVLPPKMDPKLKTYKATVPHDKRPGDKMIFVIDGKEIAISIPRGKKPGEKFQFEYGNRERVIASTLPALPGATIVEAKPMIFANVSHAFYRNNLNDRKFLCIQNLMEYWNSSKALRFVFRFFRTITSPQHHRARTDIHEPSRWESHAGGSDNAAAANR